MNKLVFLGTGAGDMGMLTQVIKTSSMYFEFDGLKFIVDPGPGTIVNAVENDIVLLELDGLIVTHPHPDHYADANPLIDSLRKKGTFLIAGKKCLEESESSYPVINKFQQNIPEKVYGIQPGDMIKIHDVVFEGVKNNHLDVGLGIKFIGSKRIGYLNDGSISGLEEFYKNMDMLIFNVYTPYQRPIMKGIHTGVDEVIEFLKKTRPKQAIIQHFSLGMLEAGIERQAEIIEKESGVKTMAAKDGMILEF